MKTKLEQYHFSSQLLVIRSCSCEPGITKWMPLFHIQILKEVSRGVSQRYSQSTVFLNWGPFIMSGEIFDVKTEEVLLASNGQKPEMLLRFLQVTSKKKNQSLDQNVSHAEVEQPWNSTSDRVDNAVS